MLMRDLFEESEPQASTVKQLAQLAIKHTRVKFHGKMWGGPILDGIARHSTWAPVSRTGKIGDPQQDFISFYVHDGKPYYAFANFNGEQDTTVIDPEKYIEIETRLGHKYSKDDFIETLLRIYKSEDERDAKSMIGDLIKASRELGNDYPEFKSIEKSLG